MPRKRGIPREIVEALDELRAKLQLNPGASSELKMTWYREIKERFGRDTSTLAMDVINAHIPKNQVNQYFIGENEVDAANNPGGQSIKQKAGGDMVGVNAGGTQTIRDITMYKQDLDQTGATISAPMKQALIESREAIEKSEIDAALKPLIIENFDKLTEELKKGDKKNAAAASGMWTMVYSVVKGVPAAVGALAALEKLATLLGY